MHRLRGAWPREVPVDPDAPEARDWLVRELANPEYEAARPTWFDLLAQRVVEWFESLRFTPGEGGFPWWLVILLSIVVLVVLVAFWIYGAPRRNRRSAAAESLFGDDDTRDSAALRRAAEQAAARGDFTLAVTELYRALARGLSERTLVSLFPGTTAHGFAREAGKAFPAARDLLESSASDFDAVRYLDESGTREQWEALRALEGELRATRVAAPETAGSST
ncbi:MAG: hypothetical protein CMF56_10625 [Leifsonia sp.]|nr:hypothetical protein [Leifsonia sp.]|tara:strand:- start:112739 stop:113404 length:666 start_codon:yes stop_codon:yes gene_type:complete